MACSGTISNWQCSHTTHIMRCAKCSLIFCGRCNQMLIRKSVAQRRELLPACPDCGEMILVDISPDNQPKNIIRHQTAEYPRPGV